MQNSEQRSEVISEEIQDAIRSMASAIRAVKLYPSNNPVYSQTVSKSFHSLDKFLKTSPELCISLQKSGFLHNNIPVEKDAHLHRTIADGLFHKGLREITFMQGLSETELKNFFNVVSLSQDEINMGGGIGSLLWEKGVTRVKVKDASLEQVILKSISPGAVYEEAEGASKSLSEVREQLKGKDILISGRRVMLSDISSDPAAFGAMMIEAAGQGGVSSEATYERLFEAYREAGSQLTKTPAQVQDHIFDAMAESIISMEPAYREGVVAKKLYIELDKGEMQRQMKDVLEQLPHGLTEMTSARFARSWTAPQVSTLLKKAVRSATYSAAVPQAGRALPQDLHAISKEMSEYTPEEMEFLRKIGDAGPEKGMVDSIVHTLIQILPMSQYSARPQPHDKTEEQFSRVVGLLEEMLSALLDRKDYALAASVLRAFQMQAEPRFRQRLADAVKRAGEKKRIAGLVDDIRAASKDSSEYHAIYSYLSLLDREATPLLLEMLAEEEDRSIRRLLIQILKDLGKNQIAMLGERLSDERWYFVRNIVGILGESKKEDVIGHLEKVADHNNFQIRHEVVRALVTIGGRKAAELMTRFLKDKDIDIQFMAVRGLGMLQAAGEKESQALMAFLKTSGIKGIEHELKKEAIETLGKIGSPASVQFLKKQFKIKWWKGRKPQEEIRAVVEKAVAAIERKGH